MKYGPPRIHLCVSSSMPNLMGRCHSISRRLLTRRIWGWRLRVADFFVRFFSLLGAPFARALVKLGFACRFFVALLRHSPTSFLRFNLILREIWFSGVLSVLIIVVSGLFVGMVLALQGYETLVRFGASSSLGV